MGRAAAAADRGRHDSSKTKDQAGAMVAADQGPSALPAAGYLEVLITWPDPEMRGCKAWPEFCLLEAFVGDAHVARKVLPIARGNVVLERKEMEGWMLHLRIPVGLDWPTLSLDLLVRRIDYVPVQEGEDLQLIRVWAPHTSRFDAVIGVARVKLLDALVFGDDDEDEEGEDRKKRRREEMQGYQPRMEGTLIFNKTMTLHDWEVTAPLEAPDIEPRPVRRGTVKVRMGMFRDWV
jgi:hypothetical protein